eukprot:2466904-Heterocapsa_arctica.AAC.1
MRSDRSRERRHQKKNEYYNTDDNNISCYKCEHYDINHDVTYGHRVDKHMHKLMTISSMDRDGENYGSSKGENGVHAHGIRQLQNINGLD